MIIIKYLNHQKEERQIWYAENWVEEIWWDLKILLDSWGEILSITKE